MVGSTLVVRKDLVLAGAGSGRKGTGPDDVLGRAPVPVVDEEGRMIAKPAEIEPHIAAYGIDLEVRDVVIQGFDAAIRAAEDESGRGGDTVVRDVVVENSGRGIVGLGSGTLTVEDTDILATTYHGISVSEGSGSSSSRT